MSKLDKLLYEAFMAGVRRTCGIPECTACSNEVLTMYDFEQWRESVSGMWPTRDKASLNG